MSYAYSEYKRQTTYYAREKGVRRLAASIIAYSGGETRSPDVRHALQGLPAFLYGRIDTKPVDIHRKKPLQWEQKPCRAMEQEEFWNEQHRSI